MAAEHIQLGKAGEQEAVAFLIKQGLSPFARLTGAWENLRWIS